MAPGLAWPLTQLRKLLSFLGSQISHEQHEEFGLKGLKCSLGFLYEGAGAWCQVHLVFKGRGLER